MRENHLYTPLKRGQFLARHSCVEIPVGYAENPFSSSVLEPVHTACILQVFRLQSCKTYGVN